MTYYKQMFSLLLLVQVIVLCCARYRNAPPTWVLPATFWDEIRDSNNNEKINNRNNFDEIDLLDKFMPISYKEKQVLHKASQADDQERAKKFLPDPLNLDGGHNLQGLWAMPGRR